MTDALISRLPCGLFRCPTWAVEKHFPEFFHLLPAFPDQGVLDVKVHMLMPGQYPCIPNWHYDFVPRDESGQKMMHARDPEARMWLLLSGPPLTEFRDGREVRPWTWTEFTQYDEHRGVASQDFCWRLFARIAPESLCPPAPPSAWERRHSQVYLDAAGFTW